MRSVIFDPRPELYPDLSGRAERLCKFIRRLKLWEGPRADEYFSLNPFQEAMIRRIYGPVSEEDGLRQVRVACIWIPRGNAKTTLASAIALCHFMGPEAEAGGQIIAAAADRENASIAFNCAHQMISKDRVLDTRVRPIESRKILIHPGTSSTFKAISTEAYTKHGLNVSFFLADEIHAWPPSEARKLWKVVTDSMVKRTEPLTFIISTAGEGMGGLAWDMWDYSHKVARGEIDDPTFAPIIFAAEHDADWRSEDVWQKANPAIEGGFCSLKELRTKAKRAEHFPTDVVDFKRFHLNIWQDGASAPWIDMEIWDKAELGLPRRELLGRKCYVGVDLSSVEDLTSVVTAFPDEGLDPDEERGVTVLAHFFLPEAGLKKKQEEDQANYLRWADEGELTLTEGNRIDQSQVIDYVMGLTRDFNVVDVAVDRWNSTAFITALQDRDVDVVEFGQGFVSMAGPVKELKSKILGRKFRHGKNQLLRMCFANVVVEKDAAENEKFTKAKARGRIDGAVASAMALGRMLAHELAPNVYRGIYSNNERYVKAFVKPEFAADDFETIRKRQAELRPEIDFRPKARAEIPETLPATLGLESESKAFELKAPEPKAPADDGKTFDPEILADMRHPLFAEHKRRFEKWQDKNFAMEREDF